LVLISSGGGCAFARYYGITKTRGGNAPDISDNIVFEGSFHVTVASVGCVGDVVGVADLDNVGC